MHPLLPTYHATKGESKRQKVGESVLYNYTIKCIILFSAVRSRAGSPTLLRCFAASLLRCYAATLLRCYAATLLRHQKGVHRVG